jgi:hypothetical protein
MSISTPKLSTDEMINHPQRLMALVFPNHFITQVHTWDDIFLPSRQQSDRLIQHGKLWSSWIHCAVYYPEFEREHDEFWVWMDENRNENGVERLRELDPDWLAIYFGLLAVSYPKGKVYGTGSGI